MTITSRISLSIVAGVTAALAASTGAYGAEPAPAPAPSPTATATSHTPEGTRPNATTIRTVHFGLAPFGGEGELDVRGFSFSLIADRVGRFSGLQLSPGLNQTLEDSRGLQLGGMANMASGDLRGVQISGSLNLTDGTMRGLQLSGGANVASSAVGMQLASVNVAGDSAGLQLGVVNVARQSSGMQLGVVNVASRSRGFSLGLINVAREHDGETLGLLNFIGNGIHDVAVYSTDTMLTNASVKLGGRHLYTSWTIGYQPGDKLASRPGPMSLGSSDRRMGLGMGLGYRFDLSLGRLQFLEIEATGMAVQPEFDFSDENVPLLTAARVIVGVELTRELTLIAGITENVSIATEGQDLDLQRAGLEKVFTSGDTTVRMYPGLLLGLQL